MGREVGRISIPGLVSQTLAVFPFPVQSWSHSYLNVCTMCLGHIEEDNIMIIKRHFFRCQYTLGYLLTYAKNLIMEWIIQLMLIILNCLVM